jgi:HSP20 family protein
MSLIKVDPFRGVDTVFRRMNEMFDGFNDGGLQFEIGEYSPRVDICDEAEGVSFNAELPGLDRKDVKITVTDDRVLTIRGEKKREEKQQNKNYTRIERKYGSFSRSFTLPSDLKLDSVKASFDKGVLTVWVAKKEPAMHKEQEIKIS